MTEPRGTEGAGRMCPECGAARAADNTPSCGCRERVSDALRDARTAEAAAAEDFDPLRIRPYVELEDEDAAETMRLRPLQSPESAAPPAPSAPTPSAQDLSLFELDTTPDDEDEPARAEEPTGAPRHRRTILLSAGGALVAVVTAAALASGMFSYEAPERQTALPGDARASLPAPPTSATPEPSATSETATPTEPGPASPSPSKQPSTENPSAASPSPSRTMASAPARPTEPTSAPPSTEAPPGDSLQESAAREPAPPVLQRGDRGPEVTELELRLTQLGLYTKEAKGTYNEGVEDAVSRYQWARGIQREEYGVYDLETRERLESETTEP
ncbi:peptidoglycan-binding protein [Streptomyces sp. UG1]|uniref:peptidoglycan-binding domain-containing protein n=1 Tax=Streptomyces sp. UG1 TaxID=3417652 RepID=UPI003CFA6B6F